MKKRSPACEERVRHIPLVMKSSLLTCLFLSIFISLALAKNTYSQVLEKKITITLDNLPFNLALEKLSTVSGVSFVFAGRVDAAEKVRVSARNEELRLVLKKLLQPYGLVYEVVNNTIILKYPGPAPSAMAAPPPLLPAQQQPVSGVVKDAQGLPLPGIVVIVKGANTAATTDENGHFTLNLRSGNDTLLFKSVGYETLETAVNGRTVLDVVMKTELKLLNQVVVVGYGTQSKRDVTTAIATLKGEKIADLPVPNATQALVGQVSGVYLQQGSGASGDAPYVRIRGNGSITSGNGPLYVIDGYPTNDASLLNALPPQDIESMDVLKDAASAAIYGSRAGNGVIIVTTKRGKAGKTRFNLDATSGFETVMHKYDLMNAQQFVEMAKEGLSYQGRPIPAFLNQPERWANTNWQDVIFRNAPYQNYQLSASGGSEKVQFAISGGYINQQGTLKNTFLKRYNLRAALDANLTDKLKVGFNIQPSFSQRRVQQTTGGNTSTGVDGIIAEALTMPPILPVWRSNGDYFVITQDPEMKTIFNDELSNPLVKLDANKDYFNTFRQTGNVYLEYAPIKGLKLGSRFNVGLVNEKEEWYVEPFLARGNGNTGNISTPNLAQIKARRNNTTKINWYWSNTATYDFSLKNGHHFTALLGYDVSRQNDFFVTIEPRTDKDNPVAFVNQQVKNVQGAVLTKATSGNSEYTFDAVFGRINYNYNSKYLLSASLRSDRSSRFGPGNRVGVFPSVSAGWNITEEPFLQDHPVISTLKIRASYGETGNDQLAGYYPWIATMQREYYNFGAADAAVVAYRPGGFSNYDLGWEKNRQTDAGIDLGLFDERIGFTVDVYKRNSNIILSADLPSINGKASSVIQNIGNVENRGLEIALNTANIRSAFNWNTSFNISFNRNKIVSLASGQQQLANQGVVRNYVGRPMGDFYLYIVEGTFNNADDLAKYPKLGSQGIGDLRYRDVSGPNGKPDGRITADDQVYAGNYQPDFVFGMGNTFSYGNFDLNILLDGAYGAEVYRSQELPLSLSRWLENGSAESLGRWRSETDPGNGRYHRAGTTNLSSDIAASTRYLSNGSFLRIRNITLGYTFPARMLSRWKIQRLRVYATGQNIYTFTKYGGFKNPQGNGAGDNATNNGVENGTYPISRNLSLAINITF